MPHVETLPDGSQLYVTRVIRPPVDSIKTADEKKAQMSNHEDLRTALANTSRNDLSYADYSRDTYDYNALMPNVGSPDSIEVAPESPRLVVANVRHLAHQDNQVTPETQATFHERAENLVEDLGITEKSLVFVVASNAKSIEAGPTPEETTVHSRTESTLDVVRDILDERGIAHLDDTFGVDGSAAPLLDGQFRTSLDEFRISNTYVNADAAAQTKANSEATAKGEALPYPGAPSAPPTVYASDAPNLQDLELRTGMEEVASATVARGLKGFDLLEDYFLRGGNIPEGVDRVVVIAGRHGQFCTDISEALLVATGKNHPIAFATNGSYSLMEAQLTPDGSVAEDYIIRSGERTGMNIK
jgi:hypothetical protein